MESRGVIDGVASHHRRYGAEEEDAPGRHQLHALRRVDDALAAPPETRGNVSASEIQRHGDAKRDPEQKKIPDRSVAAEQASDITDGGLQSPDVARDIVGDTHPEVGIHQCRRAFEQAAGEGCPALVRDLVDDLFALHKKRFRQPLRLVDLGDRMLALAPLLGDVLALLAFLRLRAELRQALAGRFETRRGGIDDLTDPVGDGVEAFACLEQVCGIDVAAGEQLLTLIEIGLRLVEPVADILDRLRDCLFRHGRLRGRRGGRRSGWDGSGRRLCRLRLRGGDGRRLRQNRNGSQEGGTHPRGKERCMSHSALHESQFHVVPFVGLGRPPLWRRHADPGARANRFQAHLRQAPWP